MSDFKILNCDVIAGLKQLEENSIDCVITSPPYWGLRDYGVEGQIGLEKHPKEYIEKMVKVFREVKRVLKLEGSVWLNLGDTYFAKRSKDETTDEYYGAGRNSGHPRSMQPDGTSWLTAKQKLLMPHRLAIAMQDDGWICRNDCVWHKPSHMPSSVKDRLTNSFEFLFHFVQKKKYYYDLDAIREPHKTENIEQKKRDIAYIGKMKENAESLNSPRARLARPNFNPDSFFNPSGKNPGDMWSINPKPYPEAHFAVFPPELVRKPLLATCPKQICKKCGKVRERISKVIGKVPKGGGASLKYAKKEAGLNLSSTSILLNKEATVKETIGFTDCKCEKGWKAGTVLDPFVGSGTTLLEAQAQGKNGIGIEINPEYVKLIKKRLSGHENQSRLFGNIEVNK